MTNQQGAPEALRLAEQYDYGDPIAYSNMWKVAVRNELLRQHARIAELEAVGAGGVQALSAAPAGFVPVAAFDRLHAHAESLAARLLAAEQAAARKLASDGTLRPHGIDSHGNYVFALSAKGQKQ